MKKLVRPQDVLLLALAGAGDVFEEVRDPFMLVSKAYENVYGFVLKKYKRNNFFKNVQRSLKTGYIEKIEKDGQVYLRLTSRGERKMHRDFSLVSLANKKWDRKWRVVFFDIEEASRRTRERLRAKLKEVGFAMVQKSVWITPHDIGADFYEFLKTCMLDDNVFVVEGEGLLVGDPKAMAKRIWRLDELEKKYKELEGEIDKIKQLAATYDDRLLLREAKLGETLGETKPDKAKLDKMKIIKLNEMKRKARAAYLTILLSDPHLPKELLPIDWIGEKVQRSIRAF